MDPVLCYCYNDPKVGVLVLSSVLCLGGRVV